MAELVATGESVTEPCYAAAMSDEAPKPQIDKFRDLARELEADEDEEHFEETVRKIAEKKPPPDADPAKGA
jgi:hypothetical protein